MVVYVAVCFSSNDFEPRVFRQFADARAFCNSEYDNGRLWIVSSTWMEE